MRNERQPLVVESTLLSFLEGFDVGFQTAFMKVTFNLITQPRSQVIILLWTYLKKTVGQPPYVNARISIKIFSYAKFIHSATDSLNQEINQYIKTTIRKLSLFKSIYQSMNKRSIRKIY